MEEKILKELFPKKKLGHRELTYTGIADKPLRRGLKRLQKDGFIDVLPGWKLGKKKPYHLKPKGRRAASRLIVGEVGKELFFRVLERLESIAKLPDDEGERVAELALEIVNMLEGKEKSTQFMQAIISLLGKTK